MRRSPIYCRNSSCANRVPLIPAHSGKPGACTLSQITLDQQSRCESYQPALPSPPPYPPDSPPEDPLAQN